VVALQILGDGLELAQVNDRPAAFCADRMRQTMLNMVVN
jgi:hypothetical protein